jgi:hypothetical protein
VIEHLAVLTMAVGDTKMAYSAMLVRGANPAKSILPENRGVGSNQGLATTYTELDSFGVHVLITEG